MLRSRLPDGCLGRLLKLTYFLNVCSDLDLLTEVFMHLWSDWLNHRADHVTPGSRRNKAPNQNAAGWGFVFCVRVLLVPDFFFLTQNLLLKKKYWRESVRSSTNSIHTLQFSSTRALIRKWPRCHSFKEVLGVTWQQAWGGVHSMKNLNVIVAVGVQSVV